MGDNSEPTGIELRLTGVPMNMSNRDLKDQVSKHLQDMEHKILVILEKYTEDLFWKSFDDPNVRNTARVIIPGAPGHNAGEALIGRGIEISHNDTNFYLPVSKIQNPETTNYKYDELLQKALEKTKKRRTDETRHPADEKKTRIEDGTLGHVYQVTCGMFDQDHKFEPTHTWSSQNGCTFNHFNYFGDMSPKKFQISLTEQEQGKPLQWEWMDLQADNIRGVIFEEPKEKDRQVVYFVINKAPQFYQRTQPEVLTENRPSPLSRSGIIHNEDGIKCVHSRIPYPSDMPHGPHDVCDIPWMIQYSRVFRVEYKSCQDFSLETCKPFLNRMQKQKILCLRHPGIEQSLRTLEDMIHTLDKNITEISKVPKLLTLPEYRLHALKFLYNCNVCAFSTEATHMIQCLLQKFRIAREVTPSERWRYCEVLKRNGQDMETSQLRALRHFHASRPEEEQKIPMEMKRSVKQPAYDEDQQLICDLDHLDGIPPVIFEALVYPSHVEIQGPIVPSSNSVFEEYEEEIHRFIRVKFADNNGKPFSVESGINPDRIIEDRFCRLLKNESPLLPLKQSCEFLGYSISGLKKRKAVWFFLSEAPLDAKTIRDAIGNWDKDGANKSLAQQPSKWGARVALAFTDSVPVAWLSQTEWKVREDEGEHNELKNTDGCGLISQELCNTINQRLGLLGYNESRAFQIRFGGSKGVVYSAPGPLLRLPDDPNDDTDDDRKMLLRKSQVKFDVPNPEKMTLRVIPTAADGHQSLFFSSVLKALDDSGANMTIIEEIYDKTYESLTKLSRDSLDILQEIFQVSDDDREDGMHARNLLLKLAVHLEDAGIFPEHYAKSFLKLYLAKLATSARSDDLFKIPIPGSHNALGLTDDYQFLEPGEVYIRSRGRTVSGPVLIYRDPIIHIGDIQKAFAVEEEYMTTKMETYPDRVAALEQMDNVIFFSQKDNPPLPNLLSGGDLDGDRFEILTQKCGFWGTKYRISAPADYNEETDSQNSGSEMKDFDVEELAKFIGQFIRNACFFNLQDTLMCLADLKEGGMNNADVKSLAKWLSQAVDYAKSGKKVDLIQDVAAKKEFRVPATPDFLRSLNPNAFNDVKGEYYQSPNFLGRIYRKVRDKKYGVPKRIDELTLREKVTEIWGPRCSKPQILIDNRGADGMFLILVRERIKDYRDHLEAHNITEETEVDLFTGTKKRDGFPNVHIEDLIMMVANHLAMYKVIKRVNVEDPDQLAGQESSVAQLLSSRLSHFSLSDTYDRRDAESFYRTQLYLAWTILNDEIESHETRLGQSYAFLCLHALFVKKFPVQH